MTRFDFDVIGDSPRKTLPNVQKPPAQDPAAGQNPPADSQPQKAEKKMQEKAA